MEAKELQLNIAQPLQDYPQEPAQEKSGAIMKLR